MRSGPWLRTLVAAIALVGAMTVRAQTTAGAGSVVVIPLVTHSTSFDSEIFVRNDQSTAITLNVRFYDRTNPPPPGLRTCNQLHVPANLTVSFTLVSQCTLNPTTGYSGMLVLEDATDVVNGYKTNFFYAYDRTQNPSGIGLSVEGFPVGNFSGQDANVIGLERVAAAPGYQSNCFVAALGEPVDYTIQLFDSTNTQIGSTLSGSLVPYQMLRFLDIFAAVGATPGDHLNARARFSATDTDPDAPALIGYCTVQENNTFGADFRIAKSRDGRDRRQKRFMCYATDPADSTCQTVDPVVANQTQLPSTSLRNIHWLFLAQPDFVKCDLVSPHLGDLEMRLRVADDVYNGSAVFVPSAPYDTNPPYTAGGAGLTGFYIFTGHRSQVGQGGQITRWFIDVQARSGATGGDFPLAYGIVCTGGNGVSVPYLRAQPARSSF